MRRSPGTILTFYSYKGGTGRSLAVANVAWILASNGKRVLVIDWDLEAPGLHRYFHPFLIDSELNDSSGLIDYFWAYAVRLMTPLSEDRAEETWHEGIADIAEYAVRLDWKFDQGGVLDFIPAGRQNEEYARRITSFDWNNFYSRLDGQHLLARLRDKLRSDYDYVLIDSRTGVSDTAGICTVAMPDRLVAMFTLNTQSVEGVAAVVESVQEERGEEPLEIYPVITRVELAEKERLETARSRVRNLFDAYARSKEGGSRAYWKDAEILYQPYYAYEEVLATFADQTGRDYSESSLVAAMLRLASRVTGESLHLPEIDRDKRDSVLLRFTQGIRPRSEEGEEVEGLEERDDRADRFFRRSSPPPIDEADRRSRMARFLQMSSTFLGLVAGALVALTSMGSFGSEATVGGLGAITAIAGVAIALFKAVEQSLGRPSLTAEWETAPEGDAGALRLRVGGRFERRLFSAFTMFAALIVIGASVYQGGPTTARTYVVIGLGVLVLLGQSVTESLQSHETWILNLWRREALERERRSYVYGISPYDRGSSAAFRLLVERVEEIVFAEPEPAPGLRRRREGVGD